MGFKSGQFFSLKRKGNENMLSDALIIPVFYFISIKCSHRTRVSNLMHDALFLRQKVSLRVAKTHSCHPPHSPHTCSPHSHALQELKDDLPDDTAWPVVMRWFIEDHQRPLNRSSFKNTRTTGHDPSDHWLLSLLESNLFGMYVQCN